MVGKCLIWQLSQSANLQDQDLWLQCEPYTTAGCRELVQGSRKCGQESLLFFLSMVVEKSCRKCFLPGSRRNCSALAVLSFVGNYPGGELGKQQEAASPSKTKKLQCCRVITGWMKTQLNSTNNKMGQQKVNLTVKNYGLRVFLIVQFPPSGPLYSFVISQKNIRLLCSRPKS